MVAALDDAALVHDHDAVGVLDGAQTVRDHEGGAALHEGVHALLHHLLGARVNARRGLVQDERRRVGHRGARDGEKLALALRELRAVAGDHGVIALRQAPDEAVRVGELGRRDALLVGGVKPAVADVVHDGAGEQVRVLQHDAQGPAQVRLPDLVDVDPVVADLAVLDVVEAVDQVGDRGLARARCAHEGDLLAGHAVERDVVQDGLLGRVAKVHRVHLERALELGVGDGAVLPVRVTPGPDVGALVAGLNGAVGQLAGVDQLHVAVILLGLLVHEGKDALRAGGGLRHKGDLLGDLRDGLRELAVERDERDDRANAEPTDAVQGERGARGGHDHVGEVAHVGVDRHDEVGGQQGAGAALPQPLVGLAEALDGVVLVVEDLDHLLAVHHLLDVAVHRAEVALLLDEVAARELGEMRGHKQHDDHEEAGHERHGNRQAAHGHEGHHERDGRVDDLGQRLAVELPQGVHVVGVDGHDVAVLVRVKVADGQALHALEGLGAEPAHGALAHGDHDALVGVGGDDAHHQDHHQPADGRGKPGEVRGPRGQHGLDVVVDEALREERRVRRHERRHEDADHHHGERGLVVLEHVAHGARERLEREGRALGAGGLLALVRLALIQVLVRALVLSLVCHGS